MAIPAQRFQFLDKETNVPISAFNAITGSAIFNAKQNLYTEVSNNIQDYLSSNAQLADAAFLIADVLTVADTLGPVRKGKGSATDLIDLSNATADLLNIGIKSIAGDNPAIMNALNILSAPCKSGVLSKNVIKGPRPAVLSCSRTGLTSRLRSGDCTKNIKNVINLMSGGNYTPTIIYTAQVESALSLLAMAGYSSGLCGVFSALTGGVVDVNVLSNIAANVITDAVGRLDIPAIMDVGLSLVGGSISAIVPGISALIMNSFTTPDVVTDAMRGNFSDKFAEAMYGIEPNWNKSEDGSMLSSANWCENPNPYDVSDMFLSQSASQDVYSCDIGTDTNPSDFVITAPDSSYLLAASKFQMPDPVEDMYKNYGALSLSY